MSFATFIEQQLPCMRRYAFAMVGNLESADKCLAQVLEGLLEARDEETPIDHFRKVDLFVLLQRSIVQHDSKSAKDVMRQLVLLLELEQFSIDKVSMILGIPLDELWHMANSEGYASKCDSMLKRDSF